MGSHYDTLGVRPDADQAAIRAAYLAQARTHHPDRHVDAPPAVRARATRTMREVNAAWSVLADPVARRRYDDDLARAAGPGARVAPPPRPRPTPTTTTTRAPSVPPRGHGEDADLVGRGIRLLPVLGIVALLLGIFVFTAFAATSDPEPPATTVAPGDLAVGACVRVTRVLTEVPCDGRQDATVASIVDVARGCPAGTSITTLDRARVACLRPAP